MTRKEIYRLPSSNTVIIIQFKRTFNKLLSLSADLVRLQGCLCIDILLFPRCSSILHSFAASPLPIDWVEYRHLKPNHPTDRTSAISSDCTLFLTSYKWHVSQLIMCFATRLYTMRSCEFMHSTENGVWIWEVRADKVKINGRIYIVSSIKCFLAAVVRCEIWRMTRQKSVKKS